MLEIAVHELVPYRPDAVSASAVSMPYLWRVGAQSALGIVSYKEQQLYAERVHHVLQWNAGIDRAFKATKASFVQGARGLKRGARLAAYIATNDVVKKNNARRASGP